MKTLKLVLVGCLIGFAACASTNNGGHVVGNPLVADSTAAKMKKPDLCDCATSKDPKVKANCACATATATSTATNTAPATKK